ncbi:MAG: YkgJ family cysteine cluster protein [Rhodoferax sp.]|uniref:YkgJ family cysteine cluster protein n=1 Tax=Rhodoferax sp. TaxID=50421 RepID=UPI003265462B
MTPTPMALEPVEQAAFLQSVANVQQAALRQLQAQPGATAVVAFVRFMQQGVDQVVAAAQQQGVQLDCAAGCSHCCQAKVEAMAPEILLIAGAIAAGSAQQQAQTIARLQAHQAVQAEGAAPWSRQPACPFLVDQLCSIYALRPASCRKAHSQDVRACRSDAAQIPQSLQLVLQAEALQLGTAAAYRQHGLDAEPQELVQAVLQALHDPSAASRWLGGDPVFGAA